MHRVRTKLLLPVILFLVATASACAEERPAADFVLRGGVIYTLTDGAPSKVEALAIQNGAVVAASTTSEVEAWIGPDTRIIELEGRFALPGLVDAHGHLQGLGRSLSTVDLIGTASAEECIQRAAKADTELPPGAWLRGRGWDQNDWEVQDFPTLEGLDRAFGDRPVVLERVDGHAIWVNSAALRRAGIDAATPDPEGGEIVRDPASGAPTGILIDNAEDLIVDIIPEPDDALIETYYRKAIAALHELGVVGVHDMGVDLQELSVLQRAEEEGWLDLRTISFIGGIEELEAYEGGPVRPGPSALLWVDGVKFYADGALGSRGAALLEDYSDRPGHQGLLIQQPDALTGMVEEGMRRDLTVAIHAIGDRGNRIALDAIFDAHANLEAEGLTLAPLAELRPRIEHVQVVHPDDFERFCQAGILPSVQPTHCTSDMPWAESRIGSERLEGAYAWRTLRDGGCRLALGSDFPVERPSPWLGLYAARTRKALDGGPSGGWSPDQRLTALEALLGFTRWTAETLGVEEWGTLAEGSRADLIVVDQDPLGPDPETLLHTKVLLTMVEGKIVFE